MKRVEILKKEYAWVNQHMPGATPEEKEQVVRKRIFRIKMKKAGITFLVSCAGLLIAMLPVVKKTIFESLAVIVWVSFQVAAVMQFVKVLHNPLTDIEEAEFRVKDSLEKTGRASKNDIKEYEKKVKQTFGQE